MNVEREIKEFAQSLKDDFLSELTEEFFQKVFSPKLELIKDDAMGDYIQIEAEIYDIEDGKIVCCDSLGLDEALFGEVRGLAEKTGKTIEEIANLTAEALSVYGQSLIDLLITKTP